MHPHLGIEGRLGTTWHKHDERILGERHKFGLDFLGSVLARVNLVTGSVRPYALLGGTYVKAVVSGPFVSGSEEESDFSWGGGISLHLRRHGFYLEYVNYIDKTEVEIWGINLGYLGRF